MANPKLGEIKCDCGCAGVAAVRQKQTGNMLYYSVCENGMDQRSGKARQDQLKAAIGQTVALVPAENPVNAELAEPKTGEWSPENNSETEEKVKTTKPRRLWLWGGIALVGAGVAYAFKVAGSASNG
ncbi:hypothetical protein AAOGI_06860 [Agarivorans albus]